jgi:hypothetical protein
VLKLQAPVPDATTTAVELMPAFQASGFRIVEQCDTMQKTICRTTLAHVADEPAECAHEDGTQSYFVTGLAIIQRL